MNPLSNLFFLLVSPSEDIISDVFFLKRRVWNCIGHSYDGAHSTAHLSLLQYEDTHNESLLYTLSDRISSIKSFTIRIKNFGFFKSNGTIFLEPVNKLDIRELHEKLTGGSVYPHITIARNLSPKDFDLAWKALKDVSYSKAFTCNCVTVLKWMGRKWQSHIYLLLA
jgi:2'-5' RNA ligase